MRSLSTKSKKKSRLTYSAGGVIVNPEGLVAVVSQKGKSWSFPKGRIESGEREMHAARREIFEETGLRYLRYVRELGTYQRPRGGKRSSSELKVITLFLFYSEDKRLKPRDPDNPEARWVKKEKISRLLSYKEDRAFFRTIAHLIDR